MRFTVTATYQSGMQSASMDTAAEAYAEARRLEAAGGSNVLIRAGTGETFSKQALWERLCRGEAD